MSKHLARHIVKLYSVKAAAAAAVSAAAASAAAAAAAAATAAAAVATAAAAVAAAAVAAAAVASAAAGNIQVSASTVTLIATAGNSTTWHHGGWCICRPPTTFYGGKTKLDTNDSL